MVCGFAGSTCGSPTTVKSFLIGDATTCGVAHGPVIHMAVKPSRKSWFGLLAVFLVFLGSPHSLVTSRHRVSALTVSGLLRCAVLPSSLRIFPPNCSVMGCKSCNCQRGLWYGNSNAFRAVRRPSTFFSLGQSAIRSFQVLGASFFGSRPAAAKSLLLMKRV